MVANFIWAIAWATALVIHDLSTNKLILIWQMLASTRTFVTRGMPLRDKVTWGHDLQMTSNRKDESNWSDTHRHVYFYLSSFFIKVTYIVYLEQYRRTHTVKAPSTHVIWHPTGTSSQISAQVWLLLLIQMLDFCCISVSDTTYMCQTSCISTMKFIGNCGYFIVHVQFSSFYLCHHLMLTLIKVNL